MIRQGLFIFAAGAAAGAALAQSGGTSALRNHNGNAPVDVAADRIELQDKADRAVFSGNVRVKQAEMTMDAARMTVAYRKAPTPGSDPQVQRIDAAGGVTVTSPTETARGNTGIYDLDRRLVTLLGNVRLTRGTNTVNGGRLVIDLTTGRSTVDGRSAGGDAVTGQTGSGRVTGRFTVPQRNN